MDRRLFGTDGIRGLANTHPMTAEIALALGKAAGRLFTRGGHRHRVVIGKDTRLSGYMIEPALTAGFISAGMDVMLLGPMPTPAVAFLTRSLRADLGVMVSASHNPFHDNGIKLFGPDGYKLSDEIEDEIEAMIAANSREGLAASADLGRARRLEDARGRYIESLKSSFPRGLTLNGLKLVVDSAHGAAYHIAADLFFELGAEVVRLGTEPDGLNINAGCGSNEPALLRETVLREKAHLGIALDGDADRLVVVDDRGDLVDGDQLLALIAASWHADGRMRGGGVVATVMSNLGLERHLRGLGLALLRTRVGDRYVVERMRAGRLQRRRRAVGAHRPLRLRDHGRRAARGIAGAGRAAPARPTRQRGGAGICAGPAAAAQRQGRAAPRSERTHGRGDAGAGGGIAERPWSAAGPRVGHRAGDPGDGRGRGRDAAERRAGQRQPRDRQAGGLSSSQPEAAHLGIALRHSRIWTRERPAESGPCH